MTWQLAFALSMVMGITRKLYLRRYSQTSRVPATIPPAASYVLGVIPVGFIAGFFLLPHHIDWSPWMFLLMVILSAAMSISNWFGFITASRIAVAPQQTIGMLTTVNTILLGWTVLGEGLTTAQFVGGGILLAASVLAIWSPVKTKSGDFKRMDTVTIWLATVSALLLAVGLVTEKALLGHMEIGGIFFVSWGVQALGMVLLASKDLSKAHWQAFRGRELKASTLLGLANGLNGALYIYAIYHSDNVSLIAVLGCMALPLTVLGAYIFLGEREHHTVLWLSLAISFIGLVIMAL